MVSLGGEHDDIVGTLEIVERMSSLDFAQRHLAVAIFPLGHKTPALVFAFQPLKLLLKVGIKRRQLLPEIIE